MTRTAISPRLAISTRLMSRPAERRAGSHRGRRRARLEQLPGADARLHVLGLLAVHAAVLELDDGVLPLPAQPLELVALAPAHGACDQLVLDALLVERLLDAPAR